MQNDPSGRGNNSIGPRNEPARGGVIDDSVRPRNDPSRRGVIDDSVLTANINAKLVTDPQFRNVQVEVVNGTVKLSGMAPSRAEAERAISIVKTVRGVTTVSSDIAVNR